MTTDLDLRAAGTSANGTRRAHMPSAHDARSRTHKELLLACCVAGIVVSCAALAAGSPSRWGTNGTVTALAACGKTVYLGGTFTIAGPATGSGTVVSPETGEPLAVSPEVAGTVRAVIPDGAGGWFIGGSIVGVAGGPCGNLAHICRDGGVSPWRPAVDGPIYALARSGNVLYVGGEFHSVDGESRSMAASFDTRTGRLTSWDPQADGIVRALQVYRGAVFVGGHFTRIGGGPHSHLAKLSGDSGHALAWDVEANSDVAAFAVSNDTLYTGGYFSVIGDTLRTLLAAVHAETGQVLGFDPEGVPEPLSAYDTEPSRVAAIAVAGGSPYVGGHFVGMGGQGRIGLAEVDRATGVASSWAPALGPVYSGWPTPSVLALQVCGSYLLVGGGFSTLDGLDRGHAAQFSLAGGVLTAWDPRANEAVYAIAANGTGVFLAGAFTTQWSWERRNGLAAIDAVTGILLPWNPASDAVTITSLAAGGGKVYVSGLFSTMGGRPRSNMAAVDSVSGLAAPWNPQSNDAAMSMVLAGGALYAGGSFTSIGGAVRTYAARLDTVTGVAGVWNPRCDDWVESMAVDGDKVFLGGWFGQAGGQPRSRLAAVDTLNGVATPWAPAPDGPVSALAVGDSVVVVGGSFGAIGGGTHSGAAVIDRESGRAEAWNLDVAGGGVTSVAISGGVIYVSGDFSFIGGQERHRVAAVDGMTGQIKDWRLDPDGVVWSSLPRNHGLWLGGAFTVVGNTPAPGVAGVDGPADVRPEHGGAIFLAQSAPNPAQEVADIAFALQTDAIVSLTVFDLAGRRVSTVMPAELRSAGPHSVSVWTAGWKPGCYFYRLETPGASAARKMIVVK